MKHFAGDHIDETIAGKNLFYQLGFLKGEMVSVQINTTSDFFETGYAALIAVSDQIIPANEERYLKPPEADSPPMPWRELKDQRLAESGLPNDRYLICRSTSWRQDNVHSHLNVALEWPHVLRLEYREGTDGS